MTDDCISTMTSNATIEYITSATLKMNASSRGSAYGMDYDGDGDRPDALGMGCGEESNKVQANGSHATNGIPR